MAKIPFDASNPDIEAVRRIMLTRLRDDESFHQLPRDDSGFNPYVEYNAPEENAIKPRPLLQELLLGQSRVRNRVPQAPPIRPSPKRSAMIRPAGVLALAVFWSPATNAQDLQRITLDGASIAEVTATFAHLTGRSIILGEDLQTHVCRNPASLAHR